MVDGCNRLRPRATCAPLMKPVCAAARACPLHIVKVAADKEPFYEQNLEDLGIYAPVSLPFNAFGSMAMARKVCACSPTFPLPPLPGVGWSRRGMPRVHR